MVLTLAMVPCRMLLAIFSMAQHQTWESPGLWEEPFSGYQETWFLLPLLVLPHYITSGVVWCDWMWVAPEEGWGHAVAFGFDPRSGGKCLKGFEQQQRLDASSELCFRK